MKKKVIKISLLSILLFNMGCLSKHDKLTEERGNEKSKKHIVEDMDSRYRERLHLLKMFTTKVPMSFTINSNGFSKKSCKEKEYKANEFNDKKNAICIEKIVKKSIVKGNSCKKSGFVTEKKESISFDENYNRIKTIYNCVNTVKPQVENTTEHIIAENVRYISVAPITNKSGKKALPKNLDLVVQNAINTIGENYVLINLTRTPRHNEYRLEGAIVGFDTLYNRSNTVDGSMYEPEGKKINLASDFGSNTAIKELTIDFILKKYDNSLKIWKYVKDVSTSKKITLMDNKDKKKFTFGLVGGGITLGRITTKSPSFSAVSRILIENSIVELLAKLDYLPYKNFLPIPPIEQNKKDFWKEKMLVSYEDKLNLPLTGKYVSNYYKHEFIIKLLNMYDRKKLKLSYAEIVNDENLNDKIILYKDIKKEEKKEKYVKFKLGKKSNSTVDANLIVNLLEDVSSRFISDNITQTDTNETSNLQPHTEE